METNSVFFSSPFDYSEIRTGYIAFQRHLNAAHKIKQNLRLVSRKVGAIVQELIFEYLFLRDVDGTGSAFNWYALAPGLEESRDREENLGRRGAGWYVKRLEIFTHVNVPTKDDANRCPGEVDKVDAAARILSCCPNVKMLALGLHAPDPSELGFADEEDVGVPPFVAVADADHDVNVNNNGGQAEAQQQNAPAQDPNHIGVVTLNDLVPYPIFSALFPSSTINCVHLRRLEWTSDIVPATNILFTYLPTLPNLESLYVNLVHAYYPSTSAANITLKKLHTLEVVSPESDPSSLLCLMATWGLDKLHRFGLTTLSDLSNPFPFYRAHGPKLGIHDFSFLGSQTGPAILHLCTQVSDMITHLRWAPLHVRRLESKTVKRIGIRGVHFRDVEHLSEDVAHLFACFNLFLSPLIAEPDNADKPSLIKTHAFPVTNLDNQTIALPPAAKRPLDAPVPRVRPHLFPSLHTVRLLDFTPALFKERKWRSSDVVMWAFWVKRFERLNIRLEDHEGTPITVVFSEVNVFLPGDEPRWWRYR